VAIVGWAAVLFAFALALKHGQANATTLIGAATFLAVAACARVLAFPVSGLVRGLPPSAELSLDVGVLVAGALSVNAPLIALGLAPMLAIDHYVRERRKYERHLSERTSPRRLTIVRQALVVGGLPGGLLVALAAAFGGRFAEASSHLWLVALFGVCFLSAHGLLQSARAVLAGQPLGPTLRRALVAVLAEVTLLPLAAVMMLVWSNRRPVVFTLLALTYLLVNFCFYRIARITAALRRRVRELQTISRTAQAMAAEVEAPRLVAALLRELHRALPGAVRMELRLARPASPGEPAGPVERYAIERGRTRVRASVVARNDWDDIQGVIIENYLDAPLGAAQARIVASLKMYGDSLGVLIVETRQAHGFDEHEAQLIEGVARQAASALENARLTTLANIDGLTGLYCRRYFDGRLAEEIERSRRFDTSFCVLLLDLDNFKKLNDSRGHLAGDRALREIARIASAQLRNVDLAARYGGEELVFLLPRTTISDAQVVAERIRLAVGSHVFPDMGRVTVSVGVAAFIDSSDEVGKVVSNVLGRADIALYRAKSLGKDRVELDLGPIDLSPSLAPITRRRRA
jgi:diguanylate cyclase (GGDEF)-like protein